MIDTKPQTKPTTMNNKEQQPEPLAAILAEMRNDNIPRIEDEAVIRCMLHNLADRIEAAAKREYAEAKDYFAKLHDGPSMICTAKNCAVRNIGLSLAATGNAAALREALQAFIDIIVRAYECDILSNGSTFCVGRRHGPCFHKDVCDKIFKARAALAAPARNCDRYADELDAQLAFLNDVWLISVDKNTMLEKDKFENWTEQMKTRYGRWLFAPAEGGAS